MAQNIDELESTKKRLFLLLKDELAGGERRLDYTVIAERLAISRTSVTYNMKLLKKAGYVGTRDGKLYLKKSG
ncbi:MAG: winged helix-turn-helix domain-containing protein [Clostridia bacterium]|nr:winged helix-turn-helix domain-containing protein [Clostridia bacterium]